MTAGALAAVTGNRRHFTICFDVDLKLASVRHRKYLLDTASMSELLQQPLFLKDLHQPFFLKESPSIVGADPPIDVGHLARLTLGERYVEFQILELFDRHAEALLDRMREVGPTGIATLAHTLSMSARAIGAWSVAEAAEALERAVAANTGLASAFRMLDCAVIEARLAICALLRIQLSPRRQKAEDCRALARCTLSGYRGAPG